MLQSGLQPAERLPFYRLADETFSEVLGLGKLVHLVVEKHVGSSEEEGLQGGKFQNLEYGCIQISLGLFVSFIEESENHVLESVVN